MTLDDLDPMPFGKYGPKGMDPRAMQDVPASYFHYLWVNGLSKDPRGDVAQYIKRNLSALRKEHPDGIW